MSLFQFGFPLRREQSSPGGSEGVEILESQLPRQEDTNLGAVDYKEAVAAVADLQDLRRFRNQIKFSREKVAHILNTAEKIASRLENSQVRMATRKS